MKRVRVRVQNEETIEDATFVSRWTSQLWTEFVDTLIAIRCFMLWLLFCHDFDADDDADADAGVDDSKEISIGRMRRWRKV